MSISDLIETRLRASMSDSSQGRRARLAATLAVGLLSRRERAIPWWPAERIAELQRRRLRALVVHAAATVPHWRELFASRGIDPASIRGAEDLARLPMIDAASLVADPMRFVSEAYRSKAGREVFKTSGSTSGLRKPIFWDHASLLLRAARGERDRVVITDLAGERWTGVVAREFMTTEWRHTLGRWLGADTEGHQRLLILPADFSSRTQRTIYSEKTMIPRRPIHYHHLPPTVPFAVAAAHLAAIRPRIVFSFGSYVDQFLHWVHASGAPVAMPRLWVYLGDRVSPGARALAQAIGCPLYSVYGAMEAGTIGFQCERREGFHLNVDLCAVRVVGDDGADVRPGETGDIVISPLDNRAIVLFNYRLGDRGTLSPVDCACGRRLPVLATMDGRRSEFVCLGDGREVSTIALEASFGAELRRTVQAQLRQSSPGRLVWRVVAAERSDRPSLAEAIVARGRQVLGESTALDVEFVDGIALTDAGKFPRAVVASGAGGALP